MNKLQKIILKIILKSDYPRFLEFKKFQPSRRLSDHSSSDLRLKAEFGLNILPKDALVGFATAFLNQIEETGKNDGQLIRLFQSEIGKAWGEAWCMSFVQFCINKVCGMFNSTPGD